MSQRYCFCTCGTLLPKVRYSQHDLNFLQYTIQILVPHVTWSAPVVSDLQIDHTQRHLSTLRETRSLPLLYLRHSSSSNPSVALPTSQLILLPFRCFTYVTGHSPTLPLLYLRHSSFSKLPVASPVSQLILQPFRHFTIFSKIFYMFDVVYVKLNRIRSRNNYHEKKHSLTSIKLLENYQHSCNLIILLLLTLILLSWAFIMCTSLFRSHELMLRKI